MSKMGLHRPFGHLNTSYDQKKGRESNWQFDSQPLKIRNWPNSLACRQHATYCCKALDKGYNFALDFIVIGGLHKKLCTFNFALDFIAIWVLHNKLCASKVARVPAGRILGLPFGSPETKIHLDVAPVERHRIYYKGEGGGFPQVWAVVSLVCPSCSWFILAPKVFQLCTNRFVLVLCRFV
jgi:hypothetical protein